MSSVANRRPHYVIRRTSLLRHRTVQRIVEEGVHDRTHRRSGSEPLIPQPERNRFGRGPRPPPPSHAPSSSPATPTMPSSDAPPRSPIEAWRQIWKDSPRNPILGGTRVT